MAIVVINLDIHNFDAMPGIVPPNALTESTQANPAINSVTTPATGYPFRSLGYPAGVPTAAYFTFATAAVGGTPVFSVAIHWYLATAAVGNVLWAVSPKGLVSGGTVYGDAVATAVTNLQGATSSRGLNIVTTISLAGASGGIASNTTNVLKVQRSGNDATDTCNTEARVRAIVFTYQDT